MKASILALAALALASPASAQTQPRTWFLLDAARAMCNASDSPKEFATFANEHPEFQGVAYPIYRKDVTKDANGDITVVVYGTSDEAPAYWVFFTSSAACEKYIAAKGIKPLRADPNLADPADIN